MARKVEIVLIDDLDGAPTDETVTFGLDAASFEIDLSEGNAAALRELMGGFIQAARRAQPSTRRGSARK